MTIEVVSVRHLEWKLLH